MPRIIIQATSRDGDTVDVTLAERVVAANLESAHYTVQLIERLAWATADAEAIEAQPPAERRSAPGTGRRARPDRRVRPRAAGSREPGPSSRR